LLQKGAGKVTLLRTRFLPENAEQILKGVDVALEGSDNFATKFLVADACHLSRVPVVHGAAVRFTGTAWSVGPEGVPCYRCLFEDVPPEGDAPNCAEAGILGPVVGVVGAMMADLALDVLREDLSRQGQIFTFDGKRQRLRSVPVTPRGTCPLCGPKARISELKRETYLAPSFAASCARESQPSSFA
jgi:molybdopterin/thiamine biosynthesis adenylyltransferase